VVGKGNTYSVLVFVVCGGDYLVMRGGDCMEETRHWELIG